jgi:hypothetical protein
MRWTREEGRVGASRARGQNVDFVLIAVGDHKGALSRPVARWDLRSRKVTPVSGWRMDLGRVGRDFLGDSLGLLQETGYTSSESVLWICQIDRWKCIILKCPFLSFLLMLKVFVLISCTVFPHLWLYFLWPKGSCSIGTPSSQARDGVIPIIELCV